MEEREWIDSFPASSRTTAEIAVLYARAVNAGEVDALVERTSEKFSSDSQSSFGGPEGREALANLLRRQAESRKARVDGVSMAFDVGATPGEGRPCAIVYQSYGPLQRGWLRVPRCFIDFGLDGEGRIAEATVVTVAPDPRRAKPAGIFPGLGGRPSEEVESGRAPAGEVGLLLFLGDGNTAHEAHGRLVAAAISQRFGCPRAREVSLRGDLSAQEEATRRRYRIEGWPALLVLHRGELLLRYVGIPPAESVVGEVSRCIAGPALPEGQKERLLTLLGKVETAMEEVWDAFETTLMGDAKYAVHQLVQVVREDSLLDDRIKGALLPHLESARDGLVIVGSTWERAMRSHARLAGAKDCIGKILEGGIDAVPPGTGGGLPPGQSTP